MTDREKLEKVRAEIERRKKLHEDSLINPIHIGFGLQNVTKAKISELTYLHSFIDSMQKEPKECMYSKDNYTDEDRKILCEGCEEECKFNKKEEHVSEDLDKEIDNAHKLFYEEVGWRCVDKNKHKRQYFIEGYLQAEKDLELTWEDMSKIRQIMFDYNAVLRAKMCIPNDEDYCKEILRRYKENIY